MREMCPPWRADLSVTYAVTIDYFCPLVPKLPIATLCYNDFQRYCHGLLVTR
jgi:hypothetical protein